MNLIRGAAGFLVTGSPVRRLLLSAVAVVVVVAIGVGLYGIDLTRDQNDPPLGGHLADNFILSKPPAPAPGATLIAGDGAEIRLAELSGQVVLLNFWATWCAPCVREMPSLDRLQAALGPEGLKVVPVSRDRGGRLTVEPFYRKHELANLEIYLDPDGSLTEAFAVRGLPTTILIDRQGRVIGELRGDAAWDSEEAMALVRHYLSNRPSSS